VTVWHLAKNLGFDAAKPDRHLVRIAEHYGFDHPRAFCTAIAQASSDPVKVVDLVVWRFLADHTLKPADVHLMLLGRKHPLEQGKSVDAG
jgi:hypothetical protein